MPTMRTLTCRSSRQIRWRATCPSVRSQGTPMMNSVDPNSLERIVPDELQSDETTGLETLQLHLDRYRFAKDNLIPGSVLDIACGVGYGTALLSNSPLVTNAIGVDISSPAIQYATQRYAQPRVNFVRSDALKFQPAYHFENIV
ncbi:MAG: hypothetical protein DMG96_24250, partial [Acidobacteria bacterium]